MPLRRLMAEHAARAMGSTLQRVEQSLEFLEALRTAGAALFAINPDLGKRLDRLKGHDRAYLAHEYFNQEWNPFYHVDVAAELSAAKVTYFGSATLIEQIEQLNFQPAQIDLLASIADRGMKETVRDSMMGTQFRRDMYLRGVLPLSFPRHRELWIDQRFALVVPRADIQLTLTTGLGVLGLHAEVYDPVLDALAQGPATLRQLLEHEKVAVRPFDEIREALTILVGMGHVQPCLPAEGEAVRAASTAAFNAAVMKRAVHSTDLSYLASPVTGAGFLLDRVGQLALAGWLAKEKDLPGYVWKVLDSQGSRMMKDGKPLITKEENLAEIAEQCEPFLTKRLPLLQQLGIAGLRGPASP